MPTATKDSTFNLKLCGACAAKITFIFMESGKRMPVDWPPQKKIILVNGRGVLVDSFRPHWVSCTESNRFRATRNRQLKLWS